MANKVVNFRDYVAAAEQCEVTLDDILDDRGLALASFLWNNEAMDAESQRKLIRHERALEKFGKEAA